MGVAPLGSSGAGGKGWITLVGVVAPVGEPGSRIRLCWLIEATPWTGETVSAPLQEACSDQHTPALVTPNV